MHTSDQCELIERMVGEYLSAWCSSPTRPQPLDPLAFETPDWDFLTPGLAHWFLAAIDNGVVEVRNGDFYRERSSADGVFEQAGRKDDVPRRTKIRRESFFEIAAVGVLALRYRWPPEQLRFQSPKGGFDFLAYADKGRENVAIAGEAKLLQRDAEALAKSFNVCGARGPHDVDECSEPPNSHKKYKELLELHPRVVWIVGPRAFANADADPDLVHRVEETSGSGVRLHQTDENELTFDSRAA